MAFKIVGSITKIISPVRWKEFNELLYWKHRKQAEHELSNDHYKYFYTTHFGLSDYYYENKVILDIGCGPRGSLEWASMALRRIGIDPLANAYLKLGADQHDMEYMNAAAEKIPLEDAECDAIFSFNSLDHVGDIDQTIREIKRITRVNGTFLVLVEVNHQPTDCEPHFITPEILVELLSPEFVCEQLEVYRPTGRGIYDAILAGDRFHDPMVTKETGYMSARFTREDIC